MSVRLTGMVNGGKRGGRGVEKGVEKGGVVTEGPPGHYDSPRNCGECGNMAESVIAQPRSSQMSTTWATATECRMESGLGFWQKKAPWMRGCVDGVPKLGTVWK